MAEPMGVRGLGPPGRDTATRGALPFRAAPAFICKACSCKCRVFTNAGIARSLELCPSTKEALKQETRCHGMFQASSTRLNQIIAVSALAASLWKKPSLLSKPPPLQTAGAVEGGRGQGATGQDGRSAPSSSPPPGAPCQQSHGAGLRL